MAEEFTIEPIQVEDCNIFENQTVIVNDDGSLQIIGAPSDNVAKNSATSMFSGKIKKGGATSTAKIVIKKKHKKNNQLTIWLRSL